MSLSQLSFKLSLLKTPWTVGIKKKEALKPESLVEWDKKEGDGEVVSRLLYNASHCQTFAAGTISRKRTLTTAGSARRPAANNRREPCDEVVEVVVSVVVVVVVRERIFRARSNQPYQPVLARLR